MKKIFNALLLTGLLVGCYEDKGNYDYSLDKMNEIKSISFTPALISSANDFIEFRMALSEDEQMRRIEAHVEQTLSDNYDNLDFYWYRSYMNEEGKYVYDTITTKGYLDIELPIGKEISYDIYLKVYDNSTTLSKYVEFTAETRPLYKNSLFVLHGEPGNRKLGNIEIIGTDTIIYSDAHSVLFTDTNPYNNAEGLAYTAYFDMNSNTYQSSEVNNLMVFNSNTTAAVYNPYGLQLKIPAMSLFKPYSSTFVYSKHFQAGVPNTEHVYRVFISRNGQVYIGNHVSALYVPGKDVAVGNQLHQTDYMITAATITDNRFVFWDAKNNRFLYMEKSDYATAEDNADAAIVDDPMLDANINFDGLSKSPVGMTAVYAYIQYRENYSESCAYFLFKDAASGSYYRYELTPLALDGEKKNIASTRADEAKPAFTISCEQLNNFNPGAQDNTIVYSSWFTSNTLFYAEGGIVYRYNVANSDKQKIYEAPEGYEISVLKFRANDGNIYSGNMGRYLSIGMNNGEYGAVAEVLLNTASDVDKDVPVTLYEKDDDGNRFGNIKDLQFTPIYFYEAPDYILNN